MKRLSFSLSSLALLTAVGCGGGTAFTLSEEINGQNPDTATNAIFGQFRLDLNSDGQNDKSAFILIASDNPDFCGDIASGTVDLENGIIIDGTMVVLQVLMQGDFLSSGGVLEIQGSEEEQEEEGTAALFSVVEGEVPQVLALSGLFLNNSVDDQTTEVTLISPAANRIEIEEFIDSQILKGNVSATLVADITNGFFEAVEIDVLLEGRFEAEHCQALSDLNLFGL